jgi:hypothetical protein
MQSAQAGRETGENGTFFGVWVRKTELQVEEGKGPFAHEDWQSEGTL